MKAINENLKQFLRRALLLLFIFLFPWKAFSQEDAWIQSLKDRFQLYNSKALQEKIYLHVDRPLYLVGESMWYKAYNVESASNQFIGMSKVAYVEVMDAANNPVMQSKMTLQQGKGNGAMIIPATLESGVYKIRCYTNWMKNFSPEFFFETSITIVNPFNKLEKPIMDQVAQTYEAVFFPEGGDLVAGLESRVGFRVINQEGKGISFNGFVVEKAGDTLVRFSPRKFGIGSFKFTPAQNKSYQVLIKDQDGRMHTYALPEVKEFGVVMAVSKSSNGELGVQVSARFEESDGGDFYLVSHTRQGKLHIEKEQMRNGLLNFMLSPTFLGAGISHLTVHDSKFRPVCERLYFKRPETTLNIEAKLPHSTFDTRQSISMDLDVRNAPTGKSFHSNLSIAIFLEDSIQGNLQSNIMSYLLLSSDLKGTIESPEYYFGGIDKELEEDTDNLMLTHGWRRFVWKDVLNSNFLKFPHLPEFDGHFMEGKITNILTGEPADNISVYLASPDAPARLYTDVSNQAGKIRFEVKDFFGPKEVVIQPNLLKDSIYQIQMESPFVKAGTSKLWSGYQFDQINESALLTRAINMQTTNAFLPKSNIDPYVVLKDSSGFFGVPDEKYFLDDYTRFPTMEEVMREYVRGVLVRRKQKEFHFRMIDKLVPKTLYTTDPMVVLDGIPVFKIDDLMQIDPLKVKKIETLNGKYFLGKESFTGVVSFTTYANDLGGFELSPKVLIMPYEGIQRQREFYEPNYDTARRLGSRIPDFRNLLYWQPNVTVNESGKAQVKFRSSDQVGTYRVVIQGMDERGTMGSKSFQFHVNRKAL
jgi:hypothetical protein